MPARQLKEERALFEKRKKEREEQHLYLQCSIITEKQFKAYQGFDLAQWDLDQTNPASPEYYRLLRTSTVGDFCKKIAEDKQLPADQIRLWVLVNRQNKTIRPDQPIIDPDMTIEDAFLKLGSRDKIFRLWVEKAETVEDGKAIWPDLQPQTNNNVPILVFLKYFDVEAQTLKGVGHIYVRKHSKVSEMIPMVGQRLGWSTGSIPTLALFEEIKHSMIEPMKPKSTFQQAEIQDGDIICFQKQLTDQEITLLKQAGSYATATEFYDYLLNRVVVRFAPKASKNLEEETFELALSRKMTYDQLAAKVGERLNVEGTHIRFCTVHATTGKLKGYVRRTLNQSLYQILNPQFNAYSAQQRNDMLLYEVMEVTLTELETKKLLKITWVSEGLTKEVSSEQFEGNRMYILTCVKDLQEVLVAKNGVIQDVLAGLQKKLNLDDDDVKTARVFTMQSGRLQKELNADYPVSSIPDYITLFAERIPEDERSVGDDGRSIDAFHFDKDPAKAHGVPFKFFIVPVGLSARIVTTQRLTGIQGEVFKDSKKRLSKRTGIKGKQFDNVKFALISKSLYAKPAYLNDGRFLELFPPFLLHADNLR